MTKPTHNHAFGRDCCPHPECVQSEDRRVDKAKALTLARKIMDGKRSSKDAKELAGLTVRLLER